jgi:hypothetical protein
MTILIIGAKFRFWALRAYFHLFDPLKVHIFLIYTKFPGRMTYFIFEPSIAQPRYPADSQITKYSVFLDF